MFLATAISSAQKRSLNQRQLEAPELEEEAYREAVRSLSAFFTRLLETETTPWKEEPSDWPGGLAEFDGIWCDSTMQELLIFRNGTCRVVIPWLGSGSCGEIAYAARLRDFDLISRRHGQFVKKGRTWCLVDFGSTNGCLINDVELEPNVPMPFQKGDVVDIGTYLFDVL